MQGKLPTHGAISLAPWEVFLEHVEVTQISWGVKWKCFNWCLSSPHQVFYLGSILSRDGARASYSKAWVLKPGEYTSTPQWLNVRVSTSSGSISTQQRQAEDRDWAHDIPPVPLCPRETNKDIRKPWRPDQNLLHESSQHLGSNYFVCLVQFCDTRLPTPASWPKVSAVQGYSGIHEECSQSSALLRMGAQQLMSACVLIQSQ